MVYNYTQFEQGMASQFEVNYLRSRFFCRPLVWSFSH